MKTTSRYTIVVLAAGSLLVSCNKSDKNASDTGTPPSAPASMAAIDEAKDILGKLTAGIEKVVAALESVTDKASAETAAATIQSVSAEISTLGPKAKALETKLSEDEKKTMETAAETGMKPVMGRMTEVMQKVMANPETAEALMPAIEAFGKAMAPPPSNSPATPE